MRQSQDSEDAGTGTPDRFTGVKMKRARRSLPPAVVDKMRAHPLLAVTARNLYIDAVAVEMAANPRNTEMRGIIRQMKAVAHFYSRLNQER